MEGPAVLAWVGKCGGAATAERQAAAAWIVVQTVATCFVAEPMRLGSEPQHARA